MIPIRASIRRPALRRDHQDQGPHCRNDKRAQRVTPELPYILRNFFWSKIDCNLFGKQRVLRKRFFLGG
jgi:hypothetical protein